MDMNDHSTLTTYGGWMVVALLGTALYYGLQKPKRAAPQKGVRRQSDAVGDTKKKLEKATKPKPKPKPSSVSKDSAVTPIDYNQDEEDAANKKAEREFARQMDKTLAGTQFSTKKSDNKRQKSVKQSKAQEISAGATEKTSAPSSTTGDADDDLSPQVSPVVGAADSRDVSDMLEPAAPGPSVLRLTGTDSAKQQKKPKAKAAEPIETKKQRQNRKKNEAARAAREEDEKERKVLLEQQRRTARIAEGRAAKDGTSFAANQPNAWAAADKSTNGGDSVQLLDTFEQEPKPKPSKETTPTPAATAKTSSTDAWSAGLPSEEEQLEMIRQEDSWSEVKTKKKGKKKENAAETAPGATSTPTSGDNAPIPASSKPRTAVNGVKKPVLNSNSSFAALTPEETHDNDEVEKEWDV
ncbi:hypothetical protein F5Y15DRAFT_308228 [Xylariaceae sp. FL0016]|nr:hypothetical protein F5Y15DRAFT_308228 [Xylariaceae sp. FL0016]